MDVNGDGVIDVLSGSYSRNEQPMAGLFQVLYGSADGFRPAEALKGSDGAPLVIPPGAEDDMNAVLQSICTRPTAVDFNGNGKLDIVSGNFGGTFMLFQGEGQGRFAPVPTMLLDRTGEPLRVDMHSDPVLYDWDGDGDLDLLSGASGGGVHLALNQGTRTEPAYDAFVTLVAPPEGHGNDMGRVMPDDSHVTGPSRETRIWVDDVNGDGKPDLLVGDSVTVMYPAEGVDLATAQAKFDEHMKRQSELFSNFEYGEDGPTREQQEEMMTKYTALEDELAKYVTRSMTGYVWLYMQR